MSVRRRREGGNVCGVVVGEGGGGGVVTPMLFVKRVDGVSIEIYNVTNQGITVEVFTAQEKFTGSFFNFT